MDGDNRRTAGTARIARQQELQEQKDKGTEGQQDCKYMEAELTCCPYALLIYVTKITLTVFCLFVILLIYSNVFGRS